MAVANPSEDEAKIRKLIDARIQAVRSRDVVGAVLHVAPDVLMFDVVNKLQCIGSEAVGQRAAEWFSAFRGPIGYEMRDLRLDVDGGVAHSHSLNRYSGTAADGSHIDMWVRVTACYRKLSGTWMVTHEHSSVPFDTETGNAAVDLSP